jgi:cell division protein ZapA (FtsZ GTPase activity inhibitor)
LSEPARVDLTVLGQTLTVRTEAPADYLRSLAKYLEERVATIKRGGVRDPHTALTLAALDIADELFRARDDVTRREGDVSARLGALVTLLEKVTPSSSS